MNYKIIKYNNEYFPHRVNKNSHKNFESCSTKKNFFFLKKYLFILKLIDSVKIPPLKLSVLSDSINLRWFLFNVYNKEGTM